MMSREKPTDPPTHPYRHTHHAMNAVRLAISETNRHRKPFLSEIPAREPVGQRGVSGHHALSARLDAIGADGGGGSRLNSSRNNMRDGADPPAP